VILKPDGIKNFTVPAEFAKEPFCDEEEAEVKVNIFDKRIWWFRED
jgi:hypothetical protein